MVTDMSTATRTSIEAYLALEYPFNVIADLDGGYVIEYPDLPGCMTQAETLDEIIPMAEDARRLWIESVYERGELEIPLPSHPEEYSGKFNVRLPRSLHRKLAESAEGEGISLNSYVAELLARGDAQAQVERRLREIEIRLKQRMGDLEDHLQTIHESIRYQSTDIPAPSSEHSPFELVWSSDQDEPRYEEALSA